MFSSMIQSVAVAFLVTASDPPAEKSSAAEREIAADRELVKAGKETLGKDRKTLVQCLAVAVKEVEGGVPVEIKAELTASEKVFGTYLLKGDKLHEVEVDVDTGKVLKTREKTVPEDRLSQYKLMASRSKIAFARAIKLAEEKCKTGKPIRVRLEQRDGKKGELVQVGVYLLDGEKLVEVEMNGEQGEVLAVKERLLR